MSANTVGSDTARDDDGSAFLSSLLQRGRDLGGGIEGYKSAWDEAVDESTKGELTTQQFHDKDGKPVDLPVFVVSAAYLDLDTYFRQLSNEMRAVLTALATSPANPSGRLSP